MKKNWVNAFTYPFLNQTPYLQVLQLKGKSIVCAYIKAFVLLISLLFSFNIWAQDGGSLQIGTLPAGKTIVIKFDAAVDDPVAEGGSKITCQGAVSGSNISNVLTDDPTTLANPDATVTEVELNSLPTITGVLANQVVDDNSAISPFISVSITDSDLPAQILTVSVSLDAAAKGDFTILNGFINESSGIYKFTGTAEAVTVAIRGLIFAPVANRVAPGDTETATFTIVVNDGHGGVFSESGTAVIVTSVNDIPVLAGVNSEQPVDDNATIAPFADILITDPDKQTLTAEILIANGINRGDFTTFSARGWGRSIIGSDIVYSRIFNVADTSSASLQAATRSLVFRPRNNSITSGWTERTNFSIHITDGAGSVSNSLTVSTVTTSVNDAPVIASNGAGTISSFTLEENLVIATTVFANDEDMMPTISYSLIGGSDADRFRIDDDTGNLGFIVTPDFEIPTDTDVNNTYEVVVRASDGTDFDDQTLLISITDVNDVAPVITANQRFNIAENSACGTFLGIVTASDGDATTTTFQGWEIITSDVNKAFAINSATGEITVNAELDRELVGTYILSLAVSDGVNSSALETVSITINDVNDVTPIITVNQSFNIDENSPIGTNVGTVVANDADVSATALQNWIITEGNTDAAFLINPKTGMLSVNASVLDFESKSFYELSLQVSDGIHLSEPASVTICLNNKPEVVTNIAFSQEIVCENQPAGTLVGSLSSISDDPKAIFVYSLTSGTGDTDNEFFLISNNEIRTAKVLNFEQKSNYLVRVGSMTQHGFSLDKELIIGINDVNEAPTLDSIADRITCYTTTQQTIPLGGISAGEDTGQVVTVSIASTNDELFSHLTTTGNEVRYCLKNGASGTSFVTVTITDNGGTRHGGIDTYSRNFEITVNSTIEVSITSDKGTFLDKGLEANLTASGGVNYQWMNAHGILSGQNFATLKVRPSQTTTYRVLVTNSSGCSAEKEITLLVTDNFRIMEANNIMTPNGDGVNDKFRIGNLDMYPNNEVKIYDRAGRILYIKKNYTDEWDGTFNGAPLAEDTYFYIVDFGLDASPIKGFITIVND